MAGTAKNSNRFDGGIRNNSFESWAASEPVGYDVTLAAGTLVQLTKQAGDLANAGVFSPEINRLALDPGTLLVKDGNSAVRIFATGVWAARSNNIRVAGTVAALTGTADFGLPWNYAAEGIFSFWARGTANKQIELQLAMRKSDGTLPAYLTVEPATWSTTQTGIAVGLIPHWQRYSVRVKFTFAVDDGGTTGEVAGLASTDSLVFGFFNVSTADPGAADPFVFDLDELYWQLRSLRGHHEEA